MGFSRWLLPPWDRQVLQSLYLCSRGAVFGVRLLAPYWKEFQLLKLWNEQQIGNQCK